MAIVEGTNAGFVLASPSVSPSGSGLVISDNAHACKFTSPNNINVITELGWYCATASPTDTNFDIGVYSDGTTKPASRLYVATVARGTTAGWKVKTGISVAVSRSTVYWLAVQVDNGTPTVNDNATANASYSMAYKLSGQTSLTDPWGTSSATQSNIQAIYALYTRVPVYMKAIFIK